MRTGNNKATVVENNGVGGRQSSVTNITSGRLRYNVKSSYVYIYIMFDIYINIVCVYTYTHTHNINLQETS